MNFGSASADITPSRNLPLGGGLFGRATGTNDRLSASAFYLEDAGRRILLIGCDLIGFNSELSDDIRTAAASASGVPMSSVLLAATHTHSGPITLDLRHWGSADAAYVRDLKKRLSGIARQAAAGTVPVLTRWSSVPCRGIGINRTSYGLAVDDTLTVLRFESASDGRLLGLIVNHGCHPVTMHGTRVYSADFPGAIRSAVRRSTRRAVPVLFLLGAAGDINPRDFAADLSGKVTPRLIAVRRALCRKVGEELAKCALGDKARDAGHGLAALSAKVSLPLQPYPDAAALLRLRKTAEAEIRRYSNDPASAWPLAEALVMRDWVRDAARSGGAKSMELEVQAFRIGAVHMLCLPVELFAAYGIEIRRRAGRRPLIVATMCNGYNSYITSNPGIERRTYEAAGVPRLLGRQPYAMGVGRRLVAGVMRVLKKL